MSDVIGVGLSQAFKNKENLTGKQSAFGTSFVPSTPTIADFVEHITAGKAWTQGYFKGCSRRKSTFISAQTIALDLDDKDQNLNVSVENCLKNEFIRRYALLVHPSPSSTAEHAKTRVVFLLSETVTSASRWEAVQRGLIRHFDDLNPDNTKDAARLFFGSTVPGAHINLDARLPLTVAGALTAYEAADDDDKLTQAALAATRHDAPGAAINHAGQGGELSPELVRDVEAALGVAGVQYTPEGFTVHPVKCPVRHHENDHHSPAAYWHRDKHFLHCFKCNADHKTHTVAQAIGIDTAPYYRQQDTDGQKPKMSFDDRVRMLTRNLSAFYQPPEFTPTHSVNMRYISDLDPTIPLEHDAAVIKSPTGTGKTEYIAGLVKALDEENDGETRVLVLTHRVALAGGLADRLGCVRYLDTDTYSHPRLVMSYNSAWKLAASGELPRYDMVFIDEHEQFQRYLDNDGTWNHDRQEAERAYKTVKALVSRSTFTAVMDAHMTDVSVAWVKSLKDHVAVIENTYTHDRGTLHLHRWKETAIAAAVQMAGEGKGCVLVPCSSRDKARDVAAIAREALGDDRVMLVYGDNSLDDDVQNFIKQINSRVNDYAMLVYSPSLGTGIDITAPVRATVGIFSGQHMTASDYHQMLGRGRNTGETHAYVQPVEEGNRETDWRVLYRIAEDRARRTGQHCDFDADGVLAVSESHQSMLKLTTMLKANENRMKNDPIAAFLALAAGYQITTSEANDDTTKERLEAAEEARKQQDKERTLAAETVDHEAMEAHRVAGTLNPDVRYGYERFKIEDTVGLDLDETLYDDLHEPGEREKLRRFTDLLDDPEHLKAIDRSEARKPLTKRRHRAIRRALAQRAISDTFGSIDSDDVIPADELVERLTPFLNLNAADVDYFFERRADASQDPIQTLRVILWKSGLRLASENRMTNGIRQQHYWIEPCQRTTMKAYAAARLKHLEAKRTERQAEHRTYHGENIGLQESRVSSLSADVQQQPPAPPDAPKSDLRARLAAGKPVNPFAKGYFE